MSAERIIEEEIKAPSVFKEKYKLFPEYIPLKLPHREEQLRRMAQMFKGVLNNPGEEMLRIFLVGGYGTGKTVTAKVFGNSLISIAKKSGLNFKYVHVNCYKARTLPQIIYNISVGLGITLPQRGLSVNELMRILLEELERKNVYAVIALDEFDYFVLANANINPLYVLVRAYDEHIRKKKRINLMFITRNPHLLNSTDIASSSYFVKSVVEFPPYNQIELYDILKERTEEALNPGVIGEEELKYIASLEAIERGGSGSARTALEILVRAGESADAEKRSSITLEDIRKAHVIVKPEIAMIQDNVEVLDRHKQILYLSIVKALKQSGSPFVRIGDIERIYKMLCETYRELPRRHTQIYTYITELKNMGLIQTRTSGKGFRGKSTLVGISTGPLYILETRIEEILERGTGSGRDIGK